MSETPHVLVVDDTEANRYAVVRHLRKAGYRVSEAADGKRALASIAGELPDLIVLDIRMPDMDGLEVVRRVRAEPRTAHLPILHLSASFTDPDSLAAGLDGGADGYLTHPVDPVVLLATVRALLRVRSAEREARQAETAWRATFEAIGDGVCVLDRTGAIERCNAAFEALVGRGGLKGRRLPDLVPALATLAAPPFVALADGSPPLGSEIAVDGKRVRVSTGLLPVADGEAVRAVCVLTDVTKQREAELRVQQAQRLEAAGQLAGGIAHEINNMMTVVLGFCEFMARSSELPQHLRRDNEEIRRAAGRAADVARQLLAFTRRQMLHPRLLDLNETLESMAHLIHQLMGADREVTFRLAPDAGMVHADEGQLEQVILNLALNARDAMTRGGNFTITTSREHLGPEFASRYPGIEIRPGDYARMTISDTGSGMDSQTLARAFEPFFTTKPVGQGSGLGLATVYGIVKQSNGYIWGESDPSVGTAWHVYLPVVSAPAGTPSRQVESPSLGRGSETILVVDDEPMVRALARRALEIQGYTVLEAEHGEAAIQQMSANGRRVSLVVADIVMPRLDGRELGVRLGLSHPGLPVLYMSGHTGDELSRRKLLEPTVPVLQKPFHPDELVARVQDLIIPRAMR
jgi:PAS domain S-box-containing protein